MLLGRYQAGLKPGCDYHRRPCGIELVMAVTEGYTSCQFRQLQGFRKSLTIGMLKVTSLCLLLSKFFNVILESQSPTKAAGLNLTCSRSRNSAGPFQVFSSDQTQRMRLLRPFD